MSNKPLKIRDYGFRPQPILADHYVFGAGMVPQDILQADGQWGAFLPIFENQSRDDFETYGCTVFGTENVIEILKKKISGIEDNYSDRDLYIISETFPPGNDPHVIAETIRDDGLVMESSLPYRQETNTFDKFRDFEGKEISLAQERAQWKAKYIFLHEWVFYTNNLSPQQKQALLMKNLQFSPLGISVRAWQQRENGLYFKEANEIDTHWCVLIGYVEGKHWIIYDSYPTTDGDSIKLLEWNYDFGFCKRYYLAPRPQAEITRNETLWQKIISFIKNIFKKIS